VTATGESTALAQIVAAVQRAQNSRANIQKLGDQVSSVFVPVVVLIALGTGLWWGLAPESARTISDWLGLYLWQAHHPEGTLAAARVLADARTGDPDTLRSAALRLAAGGDFPRAAVCYQTIADQTALPSTELLGKLGTTWLRAGDLAAAAAAFERCRAAGPSDPRPLYYLGVIAGQRGDAVGARDWYRRALAQDPTYARAAEALRGANPTVP
jgi:tetratricopeptide (TPR) repeat protein